jgi:hypothetical protein
VVKALGFAGPVLAIVGLDVPEKAGCIIRSKYTENWSPLGVTVVFGVAAFVPPKASVGPLGLMVGSGLKEFMLILCTLVVFCRVGYRQNLVKVLPGLHVKQKS